jgi:hypothetical protein
MDRREPSEISERLQYLGWRVGLSGGGRRRESNPHGFLGRAVRATTIRIALRSRRLSYGPSSGKELGGREKVGQGLATLPGGTPGLPGQGAPLPGEHRSVVRDVFVAAPLPRQEALQVGFEFLGERTPLPAFAPLALTDHRGRLAVSQEAIPDPMGSHLGGWNLLASHRCTAFDKDQPEINGPSVGRSPPRPWWPLPTSSCAGVASLCMVVPCSAHLLPLSPRHFCP